MSEDPAKISRPDIIPMMSYLRLDFCSIVKDLNNKISYLRPNQVAEVYHTQRSFSTMTVTSEGIADFKRF